MEFSMSLEKGQIALRCQTCEGSNEIKWKCLNCQTFMCSKCYNIHKKSSDKHVILDIKDIGPGSETTPDLTKINCSQHMFQKCSLYCKPCGKIVCRKCVVSDHTTHEMADIREGFQISLRKIIAMKSELEGKIRKFTSDVAILDSIMFAERPHFTTEKEKILRHEKALKEAVENHIKNLLTDLEQRWNILESSIEDEERYAVNVIKELETKNQLLGQIIDSNNAIEVFKLASEENKSKNIQRPVNTNNERLPRYVQGAINQSTVERFCGKLEKVHFRVKEQYTTTFALVSSSVCCEDGSVWISDNIREIVQNVTLSNGLVTVNKTKDLISPDMALTSSGDLLLSTMESNLKIIPRETDTERISKYGFSPQLATAVHVSKVNKIIVGTIEKELTVSVGQVIVMDMAGNYEHVYKYDNQNKPLFTRPFKITTDTDNNIYVIDVTSDIDGRVVGLVKEDGVRGIYDGHPDIRKILPQDIVTTQSDSVIVSDFYNHTLHILNNNVQCVQYLHTDHLGIYWPRSLCIDKGGFLYIGCSSLMGKRDAKIHVVQLEEF